MNASLTVALTLLLAVPAGSGQERRDEAQIAIDSLEAQMREPLAKITALDKSDREIAKSTQDQTTELARLKARETRILTYERPAVADRRMVWGLKVQRHFDNGCPRQKGTVGPPALMEKCNPVADELNKELDEIVADEQRLAKELQSIKAARVTSGATTLANFEKQKENNALRADQEALKIAQEAKLRRLYRARIADAIRKGTDVESIEKMSRACNAAPDSEKVVCCHRVVNDGVDPARCDVKLIYRLFMQGGVFPNSGK